MPRLRQHAGVSGGSVAVGRRNSVLLVCLRVGMHMLSDLAGTPGIFTSACTERIAQPPAFLRSCATLVSQVLQMLRVAGGRGPGGRAVAHVPPLRVSWQAMPYSS